MTGAHSDVPPSEPADLATRLHAAAGELATVQTQHLPAAAVLATARRAFAVAGMVSVLLDDNAVPARDACRAGDEQCRRATTLLDEALGPHLIKRYGTGTFKTDADEMRQLGEFELFLSSDVEIDKIASAMIELAATLEKVLKVVTDDESAPLELRQLADATWPAANMVWTHYGGDSGGW
jgi:hypothetical protein